MDAGQVRDKFNLSNDHYYEVAKDGGRHRVRQTFGQLVVEHAYPAQKLQLPFVRLSSGVGLREMLMLHSIKLGFQSKKLVPSTVLRSNSHPILSSGSVRCAPRRRRRTKREENSGKVGTLVRVCGRPVISAFVIRVILCYGSIP